MVWGLFPIDTLRGMQKYYIFSKGRYKVGRKDCHVIVQTDTSISREHAEIVVDMMISQDPSRSMTMSVPSSVRIVDKSKFGTVINKELATEATRLKKNQEAMLKDGDSVTFGTDNATFRFRYVPLVVFFHSLLKPVLKATISAIGAYVTSSWRSECTHVLVEKSSPLTLDLIQAVVERKPIVLSDWFKVLAESSICTEIPSCTLYAPDMVLDEKLIKVVEPKFREKILEGYTFVLGSSPMYKFDELIRPLLEVVGAKYLSTDQFSSNSQTSADGENSQFILVVPAESAYKFNHHRELSSLARVLDVKLIAVILSSKLDASIFEQPPYAVMLAFKFLAYFDNKPYAVRLHLERFRADIVSSSHSTDETVVAASDVELDTTTSDHANATSKPRDSNTDKYEDLISQTFEHGKISRSENTVNTNNSSAVDSYHKVLDSRNENAGVIRSEKNDESAVGTHENSDIIYSQNIIVRCAAYPIRSTTKEVLNFKCFRKKDTVSGNSFRNLIPFSKDPYKESDLVRDGTSEYMKEEKKRKQLEAIAEDLFNNDKVRKRAAAGASLYSLFARK